MGSEQVLGAVQRISQPLGLLVAHAHGRRLKLRLLMEAQRVAQEMGLPILSPEWSLLEAVFYGLYMGEVVEEQYFFMWLGENAGQPSSKSAILQLGHFLDWLGDAEPEESSAVHCADNGSLRGFGSREACA